MKCPYYQYREEGHLYILLEILTHSHSSDSFKLFVLLFVIQIKQLHQFKRCAIIDQKKPKQMVIYRKGGEAFVV